jgi:hypothetical protein
VHLLELRGAHRHRDLRRLLVEFDHECSQDAVAACIPLHPSSRRAQGLSRALVVPGPIAFDRILAGSGSELTSDRAIHFGIAGLGVVGGVIGIAPGPPSVADTGTGEHQVAVADVRDNPGRAPS